MLQYPNRCFSDRVFRGGSNNSRMELPFAAISTVIVGCRKKQNSVCIVNQQTSAKVNEVSEFKLLKVNLHIFRKVTKIQPSISKAYNNN